MKTLGLILIVAVLGLTAGFLPEKSWAGGVSVGIGITIPAPIGVYPAPVYYPPHYVYAPPYVPAPAVVVAGGPYYRYDRGPHYPYYKTHPKYYRRYHPRGH